MKHAKFAVSLMLCFSIFCCFSASPSFANEGEIAFKKLKQVPATVRLQTPRGIKTLDCGTMQIGAQTVLFHLYNFPKLDFGHNRLDLFMREQNKFNRVNSVSLMQYFSDFTTNAWPPTPYIDMPIIWLNVKQPDVLVVPLKVPTQAHEYDGEYWVLVFINGLSKKPFLQKFKYSEDNGFGNSGVLLNKRDERGFLIVNQFDSRTQGGPDLEYYDEWLHYWDGRKFARKLKE